MAYQSGTITQHQEQARIHRRKARTGGKAAKYGIATTTAAATMHPVAADLGAGKATKAAVVGGLGAAAGGLGYAAYHTYRGNEHADAAQAARRHRNSERAIAKADRQAEVDILVTPSPIHKALPDIAHMAGSALRDFGGGAKIGNNLARVGHSPISRTLKPTYSVMGDVSRAKRAGVHAGVTGRRAMPLADAASVGYVVGRNKGKGKTQPVAKDAFGVPIVKSAGYRAGDAARRHNRAIEAGAAAGAGAAAVGARSSARTARSARRTARTSQDRANVASTHVNERLKRHAISPGTTGHLARNDTGIRRTAALGEIAERRGREASEAFRTASRAGRRAKGLAGAAVGLGAGAAAVHRAKQPDTIRSFSYR